MKISTFEEQIKKTRERLKDFQDRAQASPEQKMTFFDEALEEFSNALEELRASEEELETQVYKRSEELATTIEALCLEKEEGRLAQKKILDQAKILDAFYRSTITPLAFLDRDFNFIRVNAAYAEACQRQVSEFPGHNHFEFYPDEGNEAIFRQVVGNKVPFQAIAKPFTFPDHPEWGVTYWDWTLTPLLDEAGEVEHLVFSLKDVTEKERAEEARRDTNTLLELFARKTERKEYLEAVVDLIHRWSNCQNVGIRILDRQGNIPYDAYRGFSPDFGASENWLSLDKDQCACIRVIQGNPDPQDLPLMTLNGSFRCNNTVEYVAHLPAEEQARFRGVCVKRGFLSMAIIPIRYQGEMLGAIHLADDQERKISQKTVEFIETMTSLIGEAVNRFNLESELKRNFETQTGINTLLRLSLEEVTLDQFLEEALDLLISLPWPGSFSKGCIFLVEEDSKALVMKAQRGFSDLHQKYFSSVPFGRCLCGQAVQKQALDFIENCQGGHEIGEGSIETHAHYFIPIQFAGRTIGLINIYLAGDQYPRNLEKEGFLTAIADTMAGIIVRRRAEEELRESENRLRHLSAKLLATQENERKKIAREVHDSLGSSLSAIKFKVEDIVQRIRLTPSVTISEPLEALVPIIQDTISEARRIQSDLRPPLLDDLGIIATFPWFCRRYQTIYSDIQVDQVITVREEEVPEPLKIVMFRITQEAMNNIGKYAGADRVQLGLRKNDRFIELTIRDNGKGFDPENLFSRESLKKGMGLSSMKERAELSGGSLAIDSQIGKGTVIKAVWSV